MRVGKLQRKEIGIRLADVEEREEKQEKGG